MVLAIPVQDSNKEKAKPLSNLLKRFHKKAGDDCLELSDYMDEELITFFDAPNRDSALQEIVKAISKKDKSFDGGEFYSAIMQRESIVSTGIGMGVAIPHAKLDAFEDFFIAIGIQKNQKGIEWDALDGMPVHMVFMIGGPANRQAEYLKILSHLSQTIKDEARRNKLLKCQTSNQVMQIFQEC